MEVVSALLPVLVIGGMLYLLIATLLSAVKLQGNDKIVWVLIIIFIFPLGSLIYLIANPHKKP